MYKTKYDVLSTVKTFEKMAKVIFVEQNKKVIIKESK